jgi:NADH dehydrogenase
VGLNHRGQIVVDAELQIPDHPGVFVAGDLAAIPPAAPHERGLPMLAPVAIQSGRHAGEQLTRLIQGQPLKTFRYRDKGVMAVLGRGEAVAELPLWSRSAGHYRLKFGGLVAWLLWLGVHIVYLISFRNRLQVLIDWAWNYFTSRGAGAILLDPPEQAPLDAPTPSPPITDSLATAKPLLPGHNRREDRLCLCDAGSTIRDRATNGTFGYLAIPDLLPAMPR